MNKPKSDEWLAGFIADSASIIKDSPSRAKSILEDIAGEHQVKLIGCLEILSRSEWKILGSDRNDAARRVALTSLRRWIKETYSASSAEPWLKAISKAYSEIDGRQDSKPHIEESSPGGQSKRWILIILTSIILITAISQQIGTRSKQKRDLQPSNQTDALNPSRPGETGSRYNQGPQSNKNISGEDGIDATRKGSIPSGRDGIDTLELWPPLKLPGKQSRNGTSDEDTRITQTKRSFSELEEGLNDGVLTLSSFIAEEALIITDHWVQAINRKGSVLMIKLRTHEYISNAICQEIQKAYKKKYAKYDIRSIKVIVQSDRPSRTQSTNGFITVCAANQSGI